MREGIGHIYLAWRKGSGFPRIIIGVIKRNATGVTFQYIKSGLVNAKKSGFVIFPDFPDENKIYSNNILEIIGQRLNKSEREDIYRYYAYWEIDPSMKNDKYYLIARTQGLLPTDNFEFLADYNPVKNLSFTSELCGLTHIKLSAHSLNEGDELTWKYDSTDKYDKYAIKVYKGSLFVGYIKKIHSRVFYKKNGNKLKIYVKSINQNGCVNRAFIKICF